MMCSITITGTGTARISCISVSTLWRAFAVDILYGVQICTHSTRRMRILTGFNVLHMWAQTMLRFNF